MNSMKDALNEIHALKIVVAALTRELQAAKPGDFSLKDNVIRDLNHAKQELTAADAEALTEATRRLIDG